MPSLSELRNAASSSSPPWHWFRWFKSSKSWHKLPVIYSYSSISLIICSIEKSMFPLSLSLFSPALCSPQNPPFHSLSLSPHTHLGYGTIYRPGWSVEQKTAYARKTGELLESLNVRFLNGRRDVKLEAKCQPCHLNRQRLNPSILSKDNVGVDQKKGLLYSICSSFLLDIAYNLMIRITIHIMKQEQSRKDPIITMYRRIDFVSSSISPQKCLQKGRKMFLIPPSFFFKAIHRLIQLVTA